VAAAARPRQTGPSPWRRPLTTWNGSGRRWAWSVGRCSVTPGAPSSPAVGGRVPPAHHGRRLPGRRRSGRSVARAVHRRAEPSARRRADALAAARQPQAYPRRGKEWCRLQWRPDFSPAGDAEGHAAALWRTRPPGTVVNGRANRELTADSAYQDLLEVAQHVKAPVILVQGADDPGRERCRWRRHRRLRGRRAGASGACSRTNAGTSP